MIVPYRNVLKVTYQENMIFYFAKVQIDILLAIGNS